MAFDVSKPLDIADDTGGDAIYNAPEQEDVGGNAKWYTGPQEIPRSADLVQARAARAHYALWNESPGLTALMPQFASDYSEGYFRKELAQRDTEQRQAVRNQLVLDAVANKGGAVTRNQANFLQGVAILAQPSDPNTVLERKFAARYTADVLTNNTSPNSTTAQASPDETAAATDKIHDVAASIEMFRQGLEDVKKDLDSRSYAGAFFKDWVLPNIPVIGQIANLATKYRLYFPDERGIPGTATNLLERAQYIWSLGGERQRQQYRADLDYLRATDLHAAAAYASAMFGMARSQELTYNLGTVMDASIIAPIAGAAALKATGRLGNVVKGAITGISDDPINLKDVYTAIGDVEKGAKAGAIRKAKEIFQSKDPLMHGMDLSDDIPLHWNPGTVVRQNPGHLATEAQNRMVSALEQSAAKSMEMSLMLPRIDRAPPEAVQVALDNAIKMFPIEYPKIEGGIIQMDLVPAEKIGSSVNFLKVTIGKRDGTLFRSESTANTYAEKEYGLDIERFSTGKQAGPKLKDIPVSPKPAEVTGFTTSKGSTYVLGENGTTIRNKAARPEHPGDEGPQPKSLKTVYITPEDARKLAPPQGQWRYADSNGKLTLITRTHEVPWGKVQSATDIPYSTTPAVGKIPVEFWNHKILQKTPTYGKVHFGNEITALTSEASSKTEITINGKTTKLENGRPVADHGPPVDGSTKATGPSIEIKPQGNGWYIQITKPLSEVDANVRDHYAIGTNNENPFSPGDAFIDAISSGRFRVTPFLTPVRGAKEVIAPFQQTNREITALVPNQVRYMIQELAKPIGKLRRESRSQLLNVLEHDKNFVDMKTGKHGRRSYSQSDLEQQWQAINGRLPTEKESLAYWTYHQLMETDLAIRNMNAHRDWSRIGAELYSFPSIVEGETGDLLHSPKFKGVFRREPDWKSKEDWAIWIQDGASGRRVTKLDGGEALKTEIERKLEQGYQVVQIPDYLDRPLREITGDKRYINYVLSKDFKSAPLPMRLVDKNDGVHVIYPHKFKTVQAKIEVGDKGRMGYYGDNTIMLADTEKDAAYGAKVFDKVRQMVKAQTPYDEIVSYIEKNINIEPEKILAEFAEGGRYSLDTPITYTKLNVSARDYDARLRTGQYSDVVDHTRSSLNLARAVDHSFLQERDLPALEGRILKSGDSPTLKVQKADTLNPLAALRKGLNNATRGMFYGDMKASAIEQWASQYVDLADNPAFARANPYNFFYNVADTQLNKTNPAAYFNAVWVRNRIKQFIGHQTDAARTASWMEEKLFNLLSGTEKGRSFVKWYQRNDYFFAKDPVSLIRSAMMDSYFGMFNPLQYFVQLQAAAHSIFVAGLRNGLSGLAYTIIQRMGLQFKPEFIDHYANIASKVTFTPKQWFIEAHNLLRASGAKIVSGEYATESVFNEPTLLPSALHRVREWGRGFFKEGERQARMTAFNAAYLEWRKANPTAIVDRNAIGQVIRRTNTLYNNMTRAGNSAIEESWLSYQLQFTTWHRRLIDQMWGRELTGWEKARAMIGHSVLYGIPMGVGIAIPWPVYDETRKYLLSEGYNMSNNTLKWLHEGLMGQISGWAMGKDYDFSRRWGPSNQPFLRDLIFGDKKFFETITGPLGSFVASGLKTAFPFWGNLYLGVTGNQQSFPLTKEDFLEPAKLISSVSNVWKAYYMINYQRYLSRNEQFLAPGADWLDAMNLVLFGTQRQTWRDAQLIIQSTKETREAQLHMQKLAIIELQRFYKASADHDWGSAETYMARAKAYMNVFGDFNQAMVADTFRKSQQNMLQGTLEAARRNFAENGPASKFHNRLQQLYNAP